MNTNLDLERFQTGKVGFIIAGTWDAARLAEAIGGDNLAIDPWPSYQNGDLSGFIETDAIYMSTHVAPENQAASRALVRYFLSAGAQNTLADPKTAAKVPTLIGVELQDKLMKEALAAFEKGTPLPAMAAMEYYWDPMDEAIRSILVNGEDPRQALEKAAIQIKIKENDISLDELLHRRH
jgi:arabinogalactan oligomer / maltooligosaccharide transport system substrate-binding protein